MPTWLIVYSLLASGMITPWFFAPMLHWTLFPGYLGSPTPHPKPTIGAPSLVDVLASGVTADKADCTDVGVITDEVDRVVLTVDHIHHSIRAAWKGTLNVSPTN